MTRRTSIKLMAGAIASAFVPLPKVEARPLKGMLLGMACNLYEPDRYYGFTLTSTENRYVTRAEFWREYELRTRERREVQ